MSEQENEIRSAYRMLNHCIRMLNQAVQHFAFIPETPVSEEDAKPREDLFKELNSISSSSFCDKARTLAALSRMAAASATPCHHYLSARDLEELQQAEKCPELLGTQENMGFQAFEAKIVAETIRTLLAEGRKNYASYERLDTFLDDLEEKLASGVPTLISGDQELIALLRKRVEALESANNRLTLQVNAMAENLAERMDEEELREAVKHWCLPQDVK